MGGHCTTRPRFCSSLCRLVRPHPHSPQLTRSLLEGESPGQIVLILDTEAETGSAVPQVGSEGGSRAPRAEESIEFIGLVENRADDGGRESVEAHAVDNPMPRRDVYQLASFMRVGSNTAHREFPNLGRVAALFATRQAAKRTPRFRLS